MQDRAKMIPGREGSFAPIWESCENRSGEPLPSCIHFGLAQTFFFSIFFVVVLCVCIVPFSALAGYTNCPVFFCFSFVSAPSIDVCKKVLKTSLMTLTAAHCVVASSMSLLMLKNPM